MDFKLKFPISIIFKYKPIVWQKRQREGGRKMEGLNMTTDCVAMVFGYWPFSFGRCVSYFDLDPLKQDKSPLGANKISIQLGF